MHIYISHICIYKSYEYVSIYITMFKIFNKYIYIYMCVYSTIHVFTNQPVSVTFVIIGLVRMVSSDPQNLPGWQPIGDHDANGVPTTRQENRGLGALSTPIPCISVATFRLRP